VVVIVINEEAQKPPQFSVTCRLFIGLRSGRRLVVRGNNGGDLSSEGCYFLAV
jgi:hypothetical protein